MVDVDGIAAYIVRLSARVGRLSLRAGGTWQRAVYSSDEPGERIELSQWLCDDDCIIHTYYCRRMYADSCRLPFVGHAVQRNQRSLSADISYRLLGWDEIWHIDRPGLAVHHFQDLFTLVYGVPLGRQNSLLARIFCTSFIQVR